MSAKDQFVSLNYNISHYAIIKKSWTKITSELIPFRPMVMPFSRLAASYVDAKLSMLGSIVI